MIAAAENPGALDRLLRFDPSHYVEHYVDMRRAELGRALGVPIDRFFGCGAYGCVWRLDDGDVVKVTADELEARYWQWLGEERKKHPEDLTGVPAVRRVSWLQTTDGILLGLVVREEIGEARATAWRWSGGMLTLEEALDDYSRAAADFYEDVDFDAVMYRLRRASDHVGEHPAGAALGRSLWWLAKHGHPPVDLHRDNIGMRKDGVLVLRDPGGVPAVSGEHIAERIVANPCCDMLTANGERYFVWTVAPRGDRPLEGWGPYTHLGNTKIHARIKAQKGKHDVTVTTDPTRDGFRIVRRYAQGSGETVHRG